MVKTIKLKKKSILILFLTSFILLPILYPLESNQSVRKSFNNISVSQTTELHLRIGVVGSAFNWDPLRYGSSIGDYYRNNALEALIAPTDKFSGDFDEFLGILSTNWDIEHRPDEINAKGFLNRGGIKAINFTLRQGITFHDGSIFNASVVKWNFDRIIQFTGNLSGNGETQLRENWWLDASKWSPFMTASWNVTQYIGKSANYMGYGPSLDPKMIGWVPIINRTTILDPGGSIGGGKIRFEFNHWGNNMLYNIAQLPIISMYSYSDYFDAIIHGYGEYPGYIQGVDLHHLIGTGPYVFVFHDEMILQEGLIVRNDNYWNATSIQAEGWHQITHVDIIIFPFGQPGYQARNIALLAGEIDYAVDNPQQPLIYDDIVANPSINYFERGVENNLDQIILNCINETYWKDHVATDGINRALRKAINYAFDYDEYINNIKNGRAVRCNSPLGIENEFYNGSLPYPTTNLTIARRSLLDDPFYGPLCAARGLSVSSSDANWQNVALMNPIHVLSYAWGVDTTDLKDLVNASLHNIGCTLNTDPSWEIPNIVMNLIIGTFPFFTHQGFNIKWPMMEFNSIIYVDAFYKNPGHLSFNMGWNFGFCYNLTVDQWIEQIYFSDRARAEQLYDAFSNWCLNYQYPCVYMSQDLIGAALRDDFEISFRRGDTSFTYIRPATEPEPPSPPGFLTLTSDAGNPDTDGDFTLTWTDSARADNYSVYTNNRMITEINGSITTLVYQTATSPFPITGATNGEHYFVIVAYNEHGDTMSNNLHVTVQLAGLPTDNEIPGYNEIALLGLTIGIIFILAKRSKKNLKSKQN